MPVPPPPSPPGAPVAVAPAVQRYAWGSRHVLAALQGRPTPTPEPEAELWFGAHPAGPCPLTDGRTLADLLAADAASTLGEDLAATAGTRLPFLLKVLAVAAPLSLQVHPDAARAAAGFAAENAAGLGPDDPRRNYRDPWAKPEIAVAVTPFHALAGLREPADARAFLAALSVEGLAGTDRALAAGASVHEVLTALLLGPSDAALVADVGAACRRVADSGGPYAADARWGAVLADAYPGDTGVLCALLMAHVELAPGEALVVPAGTLHAYLDGTCVELMGGSDNVLRGGLTPKRVDTAELLEVLDPGSGPVPVTSAAPTSVADECAYPTEVEDFRLSVLWLTGTPRTLDRRGPQLLLGLDGGATVTAGGITCPLGQGQAAFVPACATEVTLAGEGTVYRATPGLL